jgi:protease I
MVRFIAEFHLRGGIIASICHGAQMLISAGLVRGRRIAGYYSIRDDITNAGGIFVDAPAVMADRIVSSPHYRFMGQWFGSALARAQTDGVPDLEQG